MAVGRALVYCKEFSGGGTLLRSRCCWQTSVREPHLLAELDNIALSPLAELSKLRFIGQTWLRQGIGHRSTVFLAAANLLSKKEVAVDGGAGS